MPDIKEIRSIVTLIGQLTADHEELMRARAHLFGRRDNLMKLINSGEWDRESLLKQLDMLPVEERKIEDLLDSNRARKLHYENILSTLVKQD